MKYGEVSHSGHPNHPLRRHHSDTPFQCDGCRDVGLGSRLSCPLCDFDLHAHCAAAASSTAAPLRHPFYPKCVFHFLPRPPGDAPRYCNACGRDAPGFLLHCRTCGFDLHPCCAALPHVLDADSGLRLHLRRRASSACHRCGRKGRSWSYRSGCGKYELHVACVTEVLVDSWRELYGGRVGENKGTAWNNNGNIPRIRGVAASHHRGGKGKVRKCCEVAAVAAQFVISAVLGDPTALIAGIVGSFIFR